MPKMRAAQIASPNGPFEIVERPIPQPDAGWVRIKVQACGICHSDSMVTPAVRSASAEDRQSGITARHRETESR